MNRRIMLVGLVMLLAAAACNFPGEDRSNPTATNIFSTATQAQGGEATLTATSTLAPVDAATATAPSLPELNYKGLRFNYPPDLFTSFDSEIVAADPGAEDTIGWPGEAPEQIQVKVTGYPLRDTFHYPRITLYPIRVYAEVNSAAGDISRRLAEILQQGSFEAKNLPFLPMFNAGQMFAASADSFPFQNGQGIRYLTCYTQGIIAVDGDCLFYTYQGLTGDGNTYLSAIFPVHLPALETAEMKAAFEEATANYDEVKYKAYLTEVDKVIAAASPGDFTPNLDALDQVMMSVRAEPQVELKGPPAGGGFCSGAMTQRLQPDIRARVTFTDGTPLRVRQSAGKNADILGQIPEGATMVVSGGPECVGDGLWWKVKVDGSSSLEGWVLEGEGGEYFVEPWS